jgi:hypothetical protein
MAENKIFYLRIDRSLLLHQRRILNTAKIDPEVKSGIANLLEGIDDILNGYYSLAHNQLYWWLRMSIVNYSDNTVDGKDFLIEANTFAEANAIAASTVVGYYENDVDQQPEADEHGWYRFYGGEVKARIEWLQQTSPEEFLARYLEDCLVKSKGDPQL